MCRSVPQMPVRRTRISTSPGPGFGWGTSWSHSPGSAFALTSAFNVELRIRFRPPRHLCRELVVCREGWSAGGRRPPRVSTAQSFLFFLIVLGAAATALRLLSRTTPTVPYPVLLAVGGILIGLIPGLRLPPIGPDLILLAFVPGLVFEAS